ncbi:LysR family transcriptional regulator [Psychromonas ossibalaenae]|uniref:LysR family transcriptional regulator n=1 Tax=Psychromonas ossibalaenae TaxID=444922 RepID=UPI00037663F6|nr:LysR family transcriptional regulator [Psychromonas ossibalaenae]
MVDKDLNLLRLLMVLNEQRQTKLAAKYLRLSQPTISAMLKKLRIEFNDELFLRNKNHLEPTPKCEEILLQLPGIFDQISALYSSRADWSIANLSGEIQLYLPAPLIDIIAPLLINKLCTHAPNLTVECANWTSDTIQALEQDKHSWGVSYLPVSSSKNLLEKHLYEDNFMFIMGKDHPLTSNHLNKVLNYPVCVTIIPGFTEGSRMEMLIKRYKMDKQVNARLSDMNSMFKLLSTSEFIGTTSSLYKNALPSGIRCEPLPPEMNPRLFKKPLVFFTNQRNSADPLSEWLYTEIKQIIDTLQ